MPIRNIQAEILAVWCELIPGAYPELHLGDPVKQRLPNKDEITSVRLVFHYNGKSYDLVITETDNLKEKLKRYLQQNHVIRSY